MSNFNFWGDIQCFQPQPRVVLYTFFKVECSHFITKVFEAIESYFSFIFLYFHRNTSINNSGGPSDTRTRDTTFAQTQHHPNPMSDPHLLVSNFFSKNKWYHAKGQPGKPVQWSLVHFGFKFDMGGGGGTDIFSPAHYADLLWTSTHSHVFFFKDLVTTHLPWWRLFLLPERSVACPGVGQNRKGVGLIWCMRLVPAL